MNCSHVKKQPNTLVASKSCCFPSIFFLISVNHINFFISTMRFIINIMNIMFYHLNPFNVQFFRVFFEPYQCDLLKVP